MVTKVMKSDTLGNLCKNFEHELLKFMPHEYRIMHQYSAVKNIKK